MFAGTLRSIFLAFFNYQQIQKQKRDGRWKSLTKREIANQISSDDIPYRTALKVIDDFLNTIRQTVQDGDDVTLSNFGTFSAKPWNGREVQKPFTTKITKVDGRRTPMFIPSKKFKKQIN